MQNGINPCLFLARSRSCIDRHTLQLLGPYECGNPNESTEIHICSHNCFMVVWTSLSECLPIFGDGPDSAKKAKFQDWFIFTDGLIQN